MSSVILLAFSLGRNDEPPNVALAEAIVRRNEANDVGELVNLLTGKDKVLRQLNK